MSKEMIRIPLDTQTGRPLDVQMRRTLNVVKAMIDGKTIKIDGFEWGMGEGGEIGLVATRQNGEKFIFGLGEATLKQLNAALESAGIDFIVE